MVFELLRDCFIPKDSTSGFDLLFQLCTHVAQGHLSLATARLLGASRLLAIEKDSCGVRPISVGEALYRLVARSLSLHFRATFSDHFEPWQFGVATHGGCETIVHGLRATLDLHPDWVVLQLDIRNAFNIVSREAIFCELRSAPGTLDPLFPFVHSFYSKSSPLYFSLGTRTGDISTPPLRGWDTTGRSARRGSLHFGAFTSIVSYCVTAPRLYLSFLHG
ncbi:hypothetical protein R1flu_021845 [Riccia fluitans]|uniref:Reverse transcriptase domain-containing protein n=1 Tax=Riccia fluitans TaxID=41844 RepID=A0ABD1ZQJ4_9MARC